jgi:hypothetical protein
MNRLVAFFSRKRFQALQALAGVAFCAFVYWSEELGGKAAVRAALHDNHLNVYGTLAAIFGSLLGFVMTAVSITASFSSTRKMRFLGTTTVYPQIWKIFIRATKSLGAASLTCLGGLVTNRTGEHGLVFEYFALALATNAVLHIGHCLAALHKIIGLGAANDDKGATRTPTNSIARWHGRGGSEQ